MFRKCIFVQNCSNPLLRFDRFAKMDPLAGLMSMDFDFPLQAAPQFSLVQILIILSEMYTGAQDPDDDLITGLRKRWWRERSRAQSGGRIGAGMEIRWEPTFEVIGVETLDYSPTTLGGVDFDDLTSIQLFVSSLLSRFLVFETGC